MAASADDSSCSSSGKQKMSSAKRSRSSSAKILTSSSDEGTDNTQHNDASKRRHSLRKRRKKFRMPSREEQWSAISTKAGVPNKLSQLKPRKLINDFTKVTHRYNYDHVEVSGEESMEEFIKDTDSPDSSDSDSTRETKLNTKKQHRVKGYRPRIASMPESSEESEDNASRPESGVTSHTQRSCPQLGECTTGQRISKQQLTVENSPVKQKTFMTKTGHLVEDTGMLCREEENLHSSCEDIQAVNSARKSRKKSALDSDSDDLKNASSEDCQVPSVRKSKKQTVLGSDSENQNSASAAEGDSQDIKLPRKSRAKSALDSDSDAGGKEPPSEDGACLEQGENNQKSTRSNEKATSSNENCMSPSGVSPYKTSLSASKCPDRGTTSESTSENGSGSGNCKSPDKGSSEESSDGTQGEGRIQKLAAKKRRERESMFGQLKSARAKIQKKS